MISPGYKRPWNIGGCISLVSAIVTILALSFPSLLHAQTSQWTITDPGAGGAFITTQVGPTGVVYEGSDLAGIYLSQNAGGYWENKGSYDGLNEPDPSAIGIDPTNDALVLVGTEDNLYRSTDEGYDYTLVQSGGYWTSLAISKSDDEIAYGARESAYNATDGSIWKSTNNGLTWAAVSTGLPSGLRIQKLIVDPTDSDIVYFLSQTDHFASSSGQLYKSTDGGVTWTELGGSPLSSNLLDFAVDSQHPTTIYATRGDDSGNASDGTYKSTDGGMTFSRVSTHRGIVYVKFDLDSVVNVLDINGDEANNGTPIVYQSTNGGTTWASLTTFASFHDTTSEGWPTFSYGPGYAYCKSVAYDPSNSSRYYWAGFQWVYSTTDGMANWYPAYTNPSASHPGFFSGRGISNAVSQNISIPEVDDDTMYVAYDDLGLWRSLDEGYTWEEINDPTYSDSWNGKGGNVVTVLADPQRPNVVWTGQGDSDTNEKLIKSEGSGALGTWSLANSGLPTGAITGLSLSYQSNVNNRTMFVCGNGNTYKSTDDGSTWTLVLNQSGTSCFVTAVDRANGNYVYSGGTGGFWRSTDGGTTWTNTGLAAMQPVSWIAVDPSNPTWVYVAVFAPGAGLYRSKDNGQTWTKLLTDNYLREVAVHPTNANIIFVTSSKDDCCGGAPSTSTGVQRSTGGGTTWTQENQGLAWPFARGIAIDYENPQIVFIGAPGNAFQRRTFSDQ
jgi:photosystem II stability/assembly factor-like uncharacterized protein